MMHISEQLTMLEIMTGEADETILSYYLDLAGRKIIEKAYPFDPEVEEVPKRYHILQCEIAAYLINKRGAEGQTIHIENGIHRTYESASVPNSMLGAVVPFAKAVGGGR